MVGKSTLLELANKSIEEHRAKTREWAASNGVETPKLAEAPLTAQGSLEFGGLFGTAVLLQLTFDTGEKRNFNGTLYGDVAGVSGGAGVYTGALPNDGDRWNVNLKAAVYEVGVLVLAFNPFAGPWGTFTCAAAGVAGGNINYGGGHWTNG